MKNELIIDARIQKNINILKELATFNVAIRSGKFILLDGSEKNRHTYLKVIYEGDTSQVKDLIYDFNLVRIYGRIDSEQYKAKSGKTVYNKVIRAERIVPLRFSCISEQYEEIDV